MRSLFDNVYLGKPCAEQHLREIRQAIDAERLARQVQGSQPCSVIDPCQRLSLATKPVIGRLWYRMVRQSRNLTALVKVMSMDVTARKRRQINARE
jgi:hypothetical protein